MDAKLVVVGGEAKAAEIKLKLPTVIGRGREVTLTLPHPLVSRQHCEISARDGKLFVRDLGSLNGTFINNNRIEGEAELPAGDLLTIGTVTFRAVYNEDPALRPPSEEAEDAGVEATPSPGDAGVEVDQAAAAADPETDTDTDEGDFEFEEIDDLNEIDELGEDDDLEEIEDLEDVDVEEVAESVDAEAEDVEVEVVEETAPTPQIAPKTASADAATESAASSSDDDDDELAAFLQGLE